MVNNKTRIPMAKKIMRLFERVRLLVDKKTVMSLAALARAIGQKQQTLHGWLSEEREDNLWPHLTKILGCRPDVNRDWLFFGEGPMLRADIAPEPSTPATSAPALPGRPLPVLGLVPCGLEGWYTVNPIPIAATLPVTPSMFAVIAAGESMVPAGIAPGQICYCDPDQSAFAGEAVYVAAVDGRATIKEFKGEKPGKPGWLRFRGWKEQTNGKRKEFFLDLEDKDVEKIAPVIFVRRRL